MPFGLLFYRRNCCTLNAFSNPFVSIYDYVVWLERLKSVDGYSAGEDGFRYKLATVVSNLAKNSCF